MSWLRLYTKKIATARCVKTFFVAISLICFFNCQAQKTNGGFKIFFEKVYLHVDRTYYHSGEDIWYKAYLVNAQTHQPINTSNNLYVELVDPDAKIVARNVIRIDSIGTGDFHLKDSSQPGTYRIRAYTNWMRNFGDRFIFEKEIYVSSLLKPSKLQANNNRTIVSSSTQVANSDIATQFFAEGGSLVADVPSTISFKVQHSLGHGVAASGKIVSSKGETVASFETTHLGMGSFIFTPQSNITYKAFIKYANQPQVEMPFLQIATDGYVLSTTSSKDSLIVSVKTNDATAKAHPTDSLQVVVRHAGKSFFRRSLTAHQIASNLSFPTKDLPAGISYITLYDSQLRPYAERLVYIENNNELKVTITPNKEVYASKEESIIDISVTDANNSPMMANLSISVVDASMEPALSNHIAAYLLLQSELKGTIEQPLQYFNRANPNRLQQLDLLLSTQGWRTFLWRQLADTAIKIGYLPEAGITISGNVTKPASKKALDNMNITLFAPSAKGDKVYLTKTNANGKFYLDGLPLYGYQTVKINVGDGIGKTVGSIRVDSLFNNLPAVGVRPTSISDTTADVKLFSAEAVKRSSIFKNGQWFNVLPDVTVTNKRNTIVLRDGSVGVNFGYPEYDFNITQKDYEYQTLRDFLVLKVPGALYDEELEGVNFISNGQRVRPILIVNKQQNIFNRLDYYSLSMAQINSVRVRHLVGSSNAIVSQLEELDAGSDLSNRMSGGIQDFYLVVLEVKPGNYDQQFSKMIVDIAGYYESRIFYAPDYAMDDTLKNDGRITVFWAPLIKTNAEGKATIKYYNADAKTPIRIDLQGLSDGGVPIVAEKKYTIK